MNIPEAVVLAARTISKWAKETNHETLRIDNVVFSENHIIDALEKGEPIAFRMRHHLETDERDWTVMDIRFFERNKHPSYVYELLYTHPAPPSELVKAAEDALEVLEDYHASETDIANAITNLKRALSKLK